jgi:predicted DNA-binding protein with PD1-like motif
MRSRVVDTDPSGRRTMLLVFDTGEEALGGLTEFAAEHGLTGCAFTAIGALREVAVGYWNWDRKDYDRIEIAEQVEVVALTGNVASGPDGRAKVHAHIVVAKRDGTAHGGHLLRGIVRPTLEVVLTELPAHLHRRTDETTGLALLAP